MGPTILVVDDETAICDNLKTYLEDEGLVVDTAGSGEEAIERIAAGLAVRACVMDVRLPGISGAAAMREIRRIAPDVRFVIHTGSAQEAVFEELRRAGLEDTPVFSKPIADMALLARAVNDLCEPG